jgi:hypothetical protein
MQQPAPRSKAARKRGVQAEGLRTYVASVTCLRHLNSMAYLRFAQVFFAIEVHDEHVRGLHELLLHAAGRNVDLVFIAYAGSSASACYLAELARQLLSTGLSTRLLYQRLGRTQPRL